MAPIKTPLQYATPARWAEIATGNLESFIADHASCERKAHAAAMMLVNKHPELPELQDRMISLALEELHHFQQVVKLMRDRNIKLGPDEVNPYVKALLAQARNPKDQHLLDRLMIVAIIEARSAERFCLFAEALPQGDLKVFYENFAREESLHFPYLVKTASLFFSQADVDASLNQMILLDAKIMPTLELKATVH